MASAAEIIETLRAELREAEHARDGYMAERDMARELVAQSYHFMRRAFADPDSLKQRLSVMDAFADQIARNMAALDAWEAGR